MPKTTSVAILVVAEDHAMRLRLLELLRADVSLHVVAVFDEVHGAGPLLEAGPAQVLVLALRSSEFAPAATRWVMQRRPLPVVVCGAESGFEDSPTALEALQAGAVACMDLGSPPEDSSDAAGTRLRTAVRRAARTLRHLQPTPAGQTGAARDKRPPPAVIGIGASAGGPSVLQVILSGLPMHFPIPILVVQHMTRGFLPGFVQWLADGVPLAVEIATAHTPVQPGRVYLAPDDLHMGIGRDGRIVLSAHAPEHAVRPSVSYLFRSITEAYGPRAAGVLLSGMGRDGAGELRRMKDLGAVTIVQDAQTSAVHGMPGAALELGAACHVLSPPAIAAALVALAPTPSS